MMAMTNKTKNPTPTPIPTVIGIPIYKDKLLESGNHRCLHSMLQFHGIRFTERKVMIHGNYNEPGGLQKTSAISMFFIVLLDPRFLLILRVLNDVQICFLFLIEISECMPMPLQL